MGTLVDAIAGLPPWLVLLLVFALPAAEASLFIGLVIPGETAVLLGGVAAHSGSLPLWAVIVAAFLGAIVGDQVGFLLGRRYGDGLLARMPHFVQRSPEIARALSLVRRRGATAVVIGRWAAALRALVPGIAGMSGLSRIRFTLANVAGGAVWAVAISLAGYLAGASYHILEQRLGVAGEVLAAVIVLALVVWVVRGRLHDRRRDDDVARP